MRLWSLHPQLLDRAALVACWREALLAQKVLLGETKGYRNHPQLIRFRRQEDSVGAIGAFLQGIWDEADSRGYAFDSGKILKVAPVQIPVTVGQLEFEWEHLRAKVARREPAWLEHLVRLGTHPVFTVVEGAVEEWEKGA